MGVTKRAEFGKFLKTQRIAAGLTQSSVSEEFNWGTPQFLSNIERGIAFPPISILKRMAHLYKISADELYQKMEEATIDQVTRDLQRRFHSSRR